MFGVYKDLSMIFLREKEGCCYYKQTLHVL